MQAQPDFSGSMPDPAHGKPLGASIPGVPQDVPPEIVRYRLEGDVSELDFEPVVGGPDTPADGGPPDESEDEKKRLPLWQELPILLLVALVVAIIVKTFLFQSYFIPSESMRNTLEINDRVAVNKLSYVLGDIQRGQIVVFDTGEGQSEPFLDALIRLIAESVGLSSPDSVVIKRVIGLPGDTIEIIDNQLFVNGAALDESAYLGPESRMANFGPVTVQDGTYFLMGDNRGRSSDSRRIGTISEEDIIGRAFVRMWPLDRWSGL